MFDAGNEDPGKMEADQHKSQVGGSFMDILDPFYAPVGIARESLSAASRGFLENAAIRAASACCLVRAGTFRSLILCEWSQSSGGGMGTKPPSRQRFLELQAGHPTWGVNMPGLAFRG